MKANYNRQPRQSSADNLTAQQFITRYCIGKTPKEWCEIIASMLGCLDINGRWFWHNANLIITRTGEDAYSVRPLS